ncbi:MAG: 4Fe-4S dicluster domain-containing protein [Ruminococcaceae bacterium]|nr:4Fe-4S dicluster domain-containing protein [Oscillospiraceae bacterium]
MQPRFDTDVQELKYKVLKEVARLTLNDALTPENTLAISETIIPEGSKPTMRCCIYKERAILNQRVRLALGGDPANPNVVEVLPIACDECPVDGITVTQACRGCIAHRCMNACPKDAIRIVNRHAVIDKDKCIECGRCAQACSYGAILKLERPCIKACRPKAISIDPDTQKAVIDGEKCVSCGACVYQCPFGAISDKSFLTRAIRTVKNSFGNTYYHTYAVVAPSIAAQYADVTTPQVMEAIMKLGFYRVVEAAWGADAVAYHEAEELVREGFLTSSCCPAFVNLVKKNYPTLAEKVSQNLSPMAMMASQIRRQDPTAEIVFIGPCIAKKYETLYTRTKSVVDCTITFEEMQAWFDAMEIDLYSLKGIELTRSSAYGRGFARCGGLAEAVAEAIREMEGADGFELKPISCSGLQECNAALLRASKGLLKENFIEGMACDGGCLGGPACLSHSAKNRLQFSKYEQTENEKTISAALTDFDTSDLQQQ